jgi:hypothetical protein
MTSLSPAQAFLARDELVRRVSLHDGDHIGVTATFDGNRYGASAITVN